MPRDAGRPELIPPDEARALVLELVAPLPPVRLPLAEAAGLVLAEPVIAPTGLPRFDTSAMDGFAVRSGDRAGPAGLRVIGSAFAGRPFERAVEPGEAVAIATGAVVPGGADAVVRLEDAEREGSLVRIVDAVERGSNVRPAGGDVSGGATILDAGAVLGPGQLAALAGLGFSEVLVHSRPRVSILPTGDEIRPPGAPLRPGQIHDAVTAALSALVAEAGAIACPRPAAADEPEALREAVRGAAGADIVITVGGASLGERDQVHRLADVRALEVALRPGKPFVLGRVFGTPIFGLPGNPGAALVSFEELVRPALLALMGRTPTPRPTVGARLAEPITQRAGRLQLLAVEVRAETDGLVAAPAGAAGPASLASLARADGWAVIPPEVESLPAGAIVEVRLLRAPV